MDTSKLILEVDSDKFHDTYVHFLRKLYDEQFIKSYHFTVNDPVSFRRTFANKAGVKDITQRTEHTIFTKEEMEAIVEDTNNKYEECATGKYTKSVAERQMRRYRVMSRVLKETLTELGFKEAADKLLYANDLEEEQPSFVPSQEAQDKKAEILEKAKQTQDILELKKHLGDFKALVEKVNNYLSSAEKLKILPKETKEELLEVQEEFQDAINNTRQYIEKYKEYPEAEEFSKSVETTTLDIMDRFKKLQDIPTMLEQEPIQDIQEKEEVVEPEKISVETEEDYKLSLNNSVATLIPLMTEELKKFLRRCASKISEDEETVAELKAYIKDLEETIKVGDENIERLISLIKAPLTLPEDEEELFSLVKEGIEKISDKEKIKDLVMTGMKKI